MTVSNDLITLDEVKQYYDITGSKSEDDEFIETLIDNVTDLFENYCGVDSFIRQSYTEYCDGNGGKTLILKNNPIISITNIYDDTGWLWAETSLVSATDYRVVDNKYVVSLVGWTKGDANLKVTYNAGYTTIPGDLKLAAIEEVLHRFKNRAIFDLISRNLPDGSAQYVEKGMLKATKEILSKYKSLRAF